MSEFGLLESRAEGFDYHGINKQGRLVALRKFHYFKNGKSLCGKYTTNAKDGFLPFSAFMYEDEICSECLKKYKEMTNRPA